MSEIINKAREALKCVGFSGLCFVNRKGKNERDISQHSAYSCADIEAALDYAEAMEKYLYEDCSCCAHNVYRRDIDDYDCDLGAPEDCKRWQFDYERFKEGGNERED